MSGRIETYGLKWPAGARAIDIEMAMIRKGGTFKDGKKTFGNGLFHHYKALQTILWPDNVHHRWSDLILKGYCENRFTIVQGPKDCSKTNSWACILLADYWTFPHNTLWLVSSTDMRGLELRVWGAIKDLFNKGRERFPELAGNILDSQHGIFTDEIGDDGEARDIRKGIICIPCVGGSGEWVGIDKMIGIKQERRRLVGDELSFMRAPYLISVEHMDKGDFKFGGSLNPIGQGDPGDKFAEPIGGWGTEPQSTKTEVWKNRYDGITISLDGRDTPNNDEPKNQYPFLLNQTDIDRTVRRYGVNSSITWTQVYGKRKAGLIFNRVLTREMCITRRAFRKCVWGDGVITRIYACDAAFGGDRAVGGMIEFGSEVSGKIVLRIPQPRVIPIVGGIAQTPEEQLALAIKQDCEALGIPDSNVFFDAGMYATAATNISKFVGVGVNAVNFQGSATARPAGDSEYITDPKTGQKRLKLCFEAYRKFVTELWWMARLAVESEQMTELPEEVAEEFFLREWRSLPGGLVEVETKQEMKSRTSFSPDLADFVVIAIEGARRLGFAIDLVPDIIREEAKEDFLEQAVETYRRGMKKHELRYN